MNLCILCALCLTPVEIQTCAACVSSVRRDLVGIEAGFALLPGLLGGPTSPGLGSPLGAHLDDVTISDALVMLGPGSYSHVGNPSDPPAVAFELWSWAGDWCEIRREDPAGVPTDVPGLVAWLGGVRLPWAASYHPAFDEVAADMVRIRGRLDSVTGTLDAVERGAPCIYCRAVNLERRYGDTGRADDWTCPRCRRVFDEVHYRLAVGQMLATGGGA